MSDKLSDEAVEAGDDKLIAFQQAHLELQGALGLWMADRSTCEAVYPEAVETLGREMPEFASDA